MQSTQNYGLFLADDDTERFQAWREKINGVEDSNMIKIDTALGGKAQSSVAISATLLANSWSGIDAPYTQELTVAGLTESQNGIIDVAHDATTEEREIAREAILSVVGQSSGSLTIAADGEMPEFDIPVYIILLG